MSANITDRESTKGVGNTNSTPTRNRNYCFTWNNYTEKDIDTIIENSKTLGYDYVFQKEIGKNKTKHLQGILMFSNCVSFKKLKTLYPKPHWEITRNKRASILYCSKKDTRDGTGVFSSIKIQEEKKTKRERILEQYNDIKWYDWQEKILKIVEGKKDNRTIHWVWDEQGNKGKSFLAKYLYCKYKCIIGGGKKNDVLNQVKIWQEENEDEDPDIILLDISRTNKDYINYEIMEMLKNGLAYSGKYEGGIILFEKIPHIICLANFGPDMDKLSLDRWKIYNLNPVKDF